MGVCLEAAGYCLEACYSTIISLLVEGKGVKVRDESRTSCHSSLTILHVKQPEIKAKSTPHAAREVFFFKKGFFFVF